MNVFTNNYFSDGALHPPQRAVFCVRQKGRNRRHPPQRLGGGHLLFNMKRRNFCKTLIGAAVAAAIPGQAMCDILIHRGNPMTHDGTPYTVKWIAPTNPYPETLRAYQREAIRQLDLYNHGARVVFQPGCSMGKTRFIEMNFAEIEKRVLLAIDQKEKQQLKMLNDFEAAESWRDKIPKQKQA